MHCLIQVIFNLFYKMRKCETLQLIIHTYIHNFHIPTYKTVGSKKCIVWQNALHKKTKQSVKK